MLKIALLVILCDIKLIVEDITRRLVMYTAFYQLESLSDIIPNNGDVCTLLLLRFRRSLTKTSSKV